MMVFKRHRRLGLIVQADGPAGQLEARLTRSHSGPIFDADGVPIGELQVAINDEPGKTGGAADAAREQIRKQHGCKGCGDADLEGI